MLWMILTTKYNRTILSEYAIKIMITCYDEAASDIYRTST